MQTRDRTGWDGTGWDARVARVLAWQPARPVATSGAIVLAGLVLLVLRRPSALTDPGLYAEDGVIFLLESLRDGVGAILQPYNGYVHLLPRLVAAVATILPLGWTPVVYSLATALASVGAAALVLSRRFDRLAPYTARVVVFGLLVLLPRLTEVHLALNSVLWWCGVALLMTALADDPSSRAGKVGEVAMVVVAVMSGLAGPVLAPIAAARWLRTRTTHSLIVGGVWWATAGAQLVVYATQDRENGPVPVGMPLARAAVEKTVGALVLGRRAVDERWAGGTPTLVLVALLVLGAVWAAVVVTGASPFDWAPIAWTAAASTLAGFMALGPAAAQLPDRYTVLPIAALVIGLLVARPTRRLLVVGQVGLVVLVLVLRVTDVVVPSRPSTDWERSERCLAHVRRTCVVPLNPEGWTLTLPPGLR